MPVCFTAGPASQLCPAGRAACAAGAHFVGCVPCLGGLGAWGLPLVGGKRLVFEEVFG